MTVRVTAKGVFAVLLLVAGLVAGVGFASAEKGEKAQRYGMVIGLKPEKLKYYNELHADPWAGVNKALKEANIRNYSIYLTQFDDGKWYLFAYFEYTGDDFEADMRKMAADAEMKRWWKETDPCQAPLNNRGKGKWWKTMEEVYHLN